MSSSFFVFFSCLFFFFFFFFFAFAFLNIHRGGVLTALAWLRPHEIAAISAQVLCTPHNHAPRHFMQSHIRKVYACSAVTCHLQFWQNDRDLLRDTAVTRGRGGNGYRNKSQHRKSLTLLLRLLLLRRQGQAPSSQRPAFLVRTFVFNLETAPGVNHCRQ